MLISSRVSRILFSSLLATTVLPSNSKACTDLNGNQTIGGCAFVVGCDQNTGKLTIDPPSGIILLPGEVTAWVVDGASFKIHDGLVTFNEASPCKEGSPLNAFDYGYQTSNTNCTILAPQGGGTAPTNYSFTLTTSSCGPAQTGVVQVY